MNYQIYNFCEHNDELTFDKKLYIDCSFENFFNDSAVYIYGESKIRYNVYKDLQQYHGECFDYYISKFKEQPRLYNKYYTIIQEIIFNRQKNKKYTKFKKGVTSRKCKELKENKKNSCTVSVNDSWRTS